MKWATWFFFAATMYLILTEALWTWVELPGLGNVGFTLVFVLFALLHCTATEGVRRTSQFFAVSAVVAYVMEELGVRTGLIYGPYHYSDMLGTKLGHVPIIIRKDVAGFVENRVLYAVMRECLDLVEQGVIEPQDLDACVSWGIGYKLAVVGPMALLDMAGLDIYNAVGSYLNQELSARKDVAAYVTERTTQGRLGIKTGGGIYSYTPEKVAELQGARARKLVAVRKALQA